MAQSTDSFRFAFTIFTPTYNRAKTLPRVYESLQAQTYRDFEWLIVDDGSNDDTKSLVEEWQKREEFSIRYILQEHGGKHVAFNRAIEEANGRLFLNLDSDDRCVPTALERFQFHWNSIPEEERGRFSGVTALCVDQNENLVGNRFPQDVIDSDSLEIHYRFKVHGEKWGFHLTSVFREFPFPEDFAGRYLPESLVWSRIARKYKTRFVNESLRIYFIEEQSLMQGNPPARNAEGGRLQHETVLNEELDFFRYAPLQFCRSAVHYGRFSFHTKAGVVQQFRNLNNVLARFLWFFFLPIAFFVYFREKK